ncbi:MAG: hypothetical protein K940chlam1_00474 [Candidatus Anoxychlamydiales bacterium]|nr:hypothetical protein [Candidatus Anoxychlamydiales bacterium]NGX35614.1 hypothetical protein [Candidatus Anoxychlamydiales bacterium]
MLKVCQQSGANHSVFEYQRSDFSHYDSDMIMWADNFLIFYYTLFPDNEPDLLYPGSKVELANELKKKLPDIHEDLKKILGLDLSGLSLSAIPLELIYLENLKELDISDNAIKSLPEFLFIMASLKTLTAMNCGLQEIPPTIVSSNLKKINISDNNITDLSSEVIEFLDQ